MTLKSRLEKLERSAPAVVRVEGIPRPAEVAEGIWQRAMQLLADYSPQMMYGCKSLEHLVAWCRQCRPAELKDFPDPVQDAVARAAAEAETGQLPPDMMTSLRNDLATLAERPEEELVEYLRGLETRFSDQYLLPPPYSVSVLDEVAEGVSMRCLDYARKLGRGEITEAEHAAELAKFLPAVTRADQEKAVRSLWEAVLERGAPCELPAKVQETIRQPAQEDRPLAAPCRTD